MTARLTALAALLLFAPLAEACSLCSDFKSSAPTFREEAAGPMSKAILFGDIANPRAPTGSRPGETDFHITRALRTHAALKDKKTVVLPRYMPSAEKDKPKYLVFCDIDGKKLDPYRGVRVLGPGAVDYVNRAIALDKNDPVGALTFFFRHLDDRDPEVAKDAFLEFARAKDGDIQRAAKTFDAGKLRAWLADEQTPTVRVSVYAMLLGSAGTAKDAALLKSLLESKDKRVQEAADGVLAGLITLDADAGWKTAEAILADGRKPVTLRLSLFRTMRFHHGADPVKSKPPVLKAMRRALEQGELADLAIEDLRRFKMWDLTGEILPLYGKRGYDAPITGRTIVRYALCAPESAATRDFLKTRRAADAEEVKEVEEGLEIEREALKR